MWLGAQRPLELEAVLEQVQVHVEALGADGVDLGDQAVQGVGVDGLDRGHLGEPDPWQTEGGKRTRPMLDALGIVTDELRDPTAVPLQVSRGMTLAQASLAPVALLLTRDLMWEALA